MTKHVLFLIFSALILTGCDQVAGKLGLESPAVKEGRTDAEGKAVGSACRHSGRAIEDCYAIYSWLPKASVYAGWREMDEYMRENKLETIAPQLPPPEPPRSARVKNRPATPLAADTSEPAPAPTPAAAPGSTPPDNTVSKNDSSKP